MRSTEQRDETTIRIAVALLVFAGILVAGGLAITIAGATFGLGDERVQLLTVALALVAAVASARFLWRADRG